MFEIIWPQRRWVTEEQIRSWYSDAVANGEAEQDNLTDAEEMAKELSSIGHITLGRGPVMISLLDIFHRLYIDLKIVPVTFICWSIVQDVHLHFVGWYLEHGNVMSPLYNFYVHYYLLLAIAAGH